MELIDHIILFSIAAWTASYHGTMTARTKELMVGRCTITVFWALMGGVAGMHKMGIFG